MKSQLLQPAVLADNMSTSGKDGLANVKHIMKENAQMLNTMEVLDDETESILSEVLKCCVCLELPAGKQVRICEEGHHFCLTCHNKMEVCGICRGKLLETRNFVVEQLVTQLGAALGIAKCEQSAGDPPFRLSPGVYKCLHLCQRKIAAHQMLPHLRAAHAAQLVDKVRSNPFSGRFSFRYDVQFCRDKKYVWSAQVSDMGLFTVDLTFDGADFFGCVRMLGDKTVSGLFRHQLVVKIPNGCSDSVIEFSVSECPVSSYLDDVECVKRRGRGLRINGDSLLQHIQLGSTVSTFFSVWKNSTRLERKSSPSVLCPPDKHLFFPSDRKARRNKNRNMRRKRLKEKLRASSEDQELLEEISRIFL